MPETPSLAEIVDGGTRASIGNVNVCRPARVTRVVSWDVVDVLPTVRNVLFDGDGVAEGEDLPEIPHCQVAFPRAGGHILAFPVAVGDPCFLVFSDVATGAWRETGDVSDPGDLRRHSISYPYVFMGCAPDSNPLPAREAEDAQAGMLLGKEGTDAQILIGAAETLIGRAATDFAALSAKVDANFATLKAKFNAHTHLTAGTGSPVPPATLQLVGDLDSTAAARTKVQ